MSEPTKAELDEWKQCYRTPDRFFRWIESTYLAKYEKLFTLDVCATPWNSKCAEFIGPPGTMPTEGMVGVDGLTTSWRTSGAAWCNAGFNNLEPWFAQAKAQKEEGQLSVAISHALGGELWVSEYFDDGASLCHIARPRVDYDEDPRFLADLIRKGKKPAGNPKNTMIWIFDPAWAGPCEVGISPLWPKEKKSRKGKAA